MQELDDRQLLREFAETNSESAFATLVARHVDLVYSTALRFSGNPHRAEEITQAVFIILARKAGSLRRREVLSGWLYQTARLTAANVVKSEIRRQTREQEVYMQSTLNEPAVVAWEEIAPLLDDAMGDLGETDRNAVVMRYFENKTAREVAAALQVTEAAAHKRVNRALEKLRNIFRKRGVHSTTAILAGTISTNSVLVAPVALAKTLTPLALAKGATASTSTLTVIKGALKIMAWTKAKTAIVVGVSVLLAAGTATVSVEKIQEHRRYAWRIPYPLEVSVMDRVPPQVAILPSRFTSWQGVMGDGKRVFGTGVQVRDIVWAAYSHFPMVQDRTVFPQGLSESNYDFIASLPKDGLTALQRELERKFGLVARPQMRDTDVLLLEVKQRNSQGLKPATKQNTIAMDNGHIELHDWPLISFASVLEGQINIPVVDRTGLAGRFDLDLKWNPVFVGPRYSPEPVKRALEDQLGLELVPTNMPFEMLVVEKVK